MATDSEGLRLGYDHPSFDSDTDKRSIHDFAIEDLLYRKEFRVVDAQTLAWYRRKTILTAVLVVDIELIYGPDRAGDIKHSNADISKAKEKLGYDAEWSFEMGIKEAIAWYRNNL